MPGKPPVVRVVSATVLANVPARVTRAADGRLEVILRADLRLTAPVGDLITDAINSAWPYSEDEPAVVQVERADEAQPDGQGDVERAEGEAGDVSNMSRRVHELVRRSCLGARVSRRLAAPSSTTVTADLPSAGRTSTWSGRQLPLGLGLVTATLLVSTLFADSGTDGDPGDGHFGFTVDGLRPSSAMAIFVRPRDDSGVPTGD